jgi:hypothetical protein
MAREPPPRQHPFGSGHAALSARLPGALRLAGSLLGGSCARPGIGSPHGAPTGPARLERGYFVPHDRDTVGVGPLSAPGRGSRETRPIGYDISLPLPSPLSPTPNANGFLRAPCRVRRLLLEFPSRRVVPRRSEPFHLARRVLTAARRNPRACLPTSPQRQQGTACPGGK